MEEQKKLINTSVRTSILVCVDEDMSELLKQHDFIQWANGSGEK